MNGQSVPGTARLVSDHLYGCSNHFRQWQEGGCYDVMTRFGFGLHMSQC